MNMTRGSYHIGTRIRGYLKANGIKQTFVAENTNLTDSKVSDILNERRNIDCVEYFSICSVLGLPMEYFFEDFKHENQ